jgi:MarR family transcriptional repressor of emrRAB
LRSSREPVKYYGDELPRHRTTGGDALHSNFTSGSIVSRFSVSPDGFLSDDAVQGISQRAQALDPSADPLAIEMMRMIGTTYAALHRVVEPTLSEFGLSGARFSVLRVLYDADSEPLTMSELARRLSVTPPNITRLIRGLKQDGFVDQIDDGGDRRVAQIALTQSGRERFETSAPESWKQVHQSCAGLEADEKRFLIHLLAKLRLTIAARPARPELTVPEELEQVP